MMRKRGKMVLASDDEEDYIDGNTEGGEYNDEEVKKNNPSPLPLKDSSFEFIKPEIPSNVEFLKGKNEKKRKREDEEDYERRDIPRKQNVTVHQESPLRVTIKSLPSIRSKRTSRSAVNYAEVDRFGKPDYEEEEVLSWYENNEGTTTSKKQSSKKRRKSNSKTTQISEEKVNEEGSRNRPRTAASKINYAEIDRLGRPDYEEDEVASWSEEHENMNTEPEMEEDEYDQEHDIIVTRDGSFLVTEKVFEKILAYRVKGANRSVPSNTELAINDRELEFLVKWKGLSYFQAEWVPVSFLYNEKMGRTRVQRFLKKNPVLDPVEPFNSSYLIVERIINAVMYKNKIYYLVKWEGLQYSDVTWECEDVIKDEEQIQAYNKRRQRPPEDKLFLPPRPLPLEFEPVKKPPVYKSDLELRSYQLEGVNWLLYSWFNRTNSILADEMGLGKTVQTVAILNHLDMEEGIRGPFLIVVPLSTIMHWQREFERWTDLNALVYHGNVASREIIRRYEWYYEDKRGYSDFNGPYKFNVIITTYEMLIADSKIFRSIEWQYCVIDEAHRLKNKDSRLTSELAHIKYHQLTLLTGTPIQNNIEELWTLLHLLDPTKFARYSVFEKDFGDMKDPTQVLKLQEILKPYLLRRMKEDVEKSIAPKEETIIEVELTRIQKKYYRSILERNFDHLSKGGKVTNLPSLMNVMMQLRNCCNHPFLLQGIEEHELQGKTDIHQINQLLIEASGKLVLIDKLLPKLMADNHKVLIFSQMVRVLDILNDYLNYRGIRHERIDGGVRGADRQSAIDRFSRKNSDVSVFLLCTRAGGLGINLTAADTVIIFDGDWNPQNDLQAQARCHRIGQDKKVTIYRLITRKTYERTMFDRASLKLGLDHAVLTQMEDTVTEKQSGSDMKKVKSLTSKEVAALLKNGAYDLFHDDESSNAFCEENIDQILSQRTQTIVRDEKTGVSTFSKASFTSESAQPDLDIDDPDFWDKLMPDLSKKYDKRKSRIYDEDSDLDVSESGSDDEGEQVKTEKKRKSLWSLVLRNKFQKSLLLFGYGRWTKIRQSAKLKFDEPEIIRYAEAYMRKLCSALNLSVEEVKKDILNPNEEIDYKSIFEEKEKPVEEQPSTQQANPDTTGTSPMEITTSTTKETANDAIPTEYDDDPTLTEAPFLTKLLKTAKNIQRRLQLLTELDDLVRKGFSMFGKQWPEITGENPEWWGNDEDRDLIIGIHKHGFGKYDLVRSDKTLCFFGRVKAEIKEKKKKNRKFSKSDKRKKAEIVSESDSSLYDWPSAKWLSLRFKQVLRECLEFRQKLVRRAARKARKLKKAAEKALKLEQEKKKKEKEKKKKEEWSKRELNEFYRVVTTYGVPWKRESADYDFMFVKKEAKLKQKEISAIQKHYYNFLSMCKKIIQQKSEISVEQNEEFTITAVQAKRALERITMFTNLRKKVLCLSDEELNQKFQVLIAPSICKRSRLPSWWIPIEHDKALIKGIDKHGFGKWEDIFKDPNSVFYSLYQSKSATQKKISSEESTEVGVSNVDVTDTTTSSKESKSHRKKSKSKPNDNSFSSLLGLPKDKIFFKRLNFLIKTVSNTNQTLLNLQILQKVNSENTHSKDNGVDDSVTSEPIETESEIEEKAYEEPIVNTKGNNKRKSKTTKKESQPSKRRKTMDIKRDEDGEIIFPIELGVLTIESLGTVVDKKNFHSDKYIWPVGYRSKREYTSTSDVTKRCKYICEIKDGGDRPIFVVTDPDNLDNPISGNSASSAWKQMLDRINAKRTTESKRSSVSGPEYFGFGLPQVAELISKLPGVEKCERYGPKDKKKAPPKQPASVPIPQSLIDDPIEDPDEPQEKPSSTNTTIPAPQVPPVQRPPVMEHYLQPFMSSYMKTLEPNYFKIPTNPHSVSHASTGAVNVSSLAPMYSYQPGYGNRQDMPYYTNPQVPSSLIHHHNIYGVSPQQQSTVQKNVLPKYYYQPQDGSNNI